jgi:outer membrane protein TolC
MHNFLYRYLLFFLTCGLASAQLQLTLADAVRRAVENQPEVVAERAQRDTAGALVTAAKGAFDPIFGLNAGWRQARTPASSVLQGVNGRLDERFWTQGLTLTQRLPFLGIQLVSSLENQRVSTSNPFTSLNPYYQFVQRDLVRIPLWRFRKTDEFRTELKVRMRGRQLADAEFSARLLEIAHRAEQAYWNLAAAEDALRAAEEIERAALESLASTERLATQGELADSDVTGARGQAARAREAKADAAGTLAEAAATLKGLLAGGIEDPVWRQSITAIEHRAEDNAQDLPTLTQLALTDHPELRAANIRIDAQRDQTQLAASAAAPRVDLEFGRTAQGLAGTSVPQGNLFPGFSLDAPPQLVGGFGRAATQVWRSRFPTYEASLSIELPLRNRAAQGRLAEQRLIERRLTALKSQAQVQLATGIAQAHARLTAARERITAAEIALHESELRLNSELRLFREGQSNNLNLNTRQNELAQSRQLLVNSARGFNFAIADLRRISARTFQNFGIQVE